MTARLIGLVAAGSLILAANVRVSGLLFLAQRPSKQRSLSG